ncbi:ABC transporter substrate-binding protein [Paenibacillus sp. UNC451MF]|uniref:ABC transporter substrate-binding protein n=1 Tax=Paenibacillus sp. UNC451MF TaxID=1449063 RepID=UPI00048E0A92|nr:extracellular solute-binding protein [Paenibacillus sp. UNC451MF]
MKKLGMALVLFVLATGCSTAKDGGGQVKETVNAVPSVSTEPVTLKVYLNVGVSEKEAQLFYIEPLKKKYPNITLDFVNMNPTKENHINTLIASGNLPDLVIASTTGVQTFQKIDFTADLNPLVKKFDTDLSRLDPITLETLKSYSNKGELMGLPVTMSFPALYYNKDIFDKFGIAYPKDGMTWDEAIAIAKKLTRTENGIRYRGLNPGGADLMGYGLSLPYVDVQSNKPVLETDTWIKVVSKAAEIYSIPGWLDGNLPSGQGQNDFTKLKDTAMIGSWSMLAALEKLQQEGQPMNWDMVTIPNFEEAKGTGREIDFQMFMISKNSKHQEQAFQAISYFLSDEVQTIINQNGNLTVLKKTQEYQNNFGTNLPSLKGKNLNAIFGAKPGKLHPPTPYDGEARKKLNAAAYEVGASKIDVNSALRSVNEQMGKFIASDQGNVK